MSPLSGPIGLPMERGVPPASLDPLLRPEVALALTLLPIAVVAALSERPVVAVLGEAWLAFGLLALLAVLPADAPRWMHRGPFLGAAGAGVLVVATVVGLTGTSGAAQLDVAGRALVAGGAAVCGMALLFGAHASPVGIGLAAGSVLWALDGPFEATWIGIAAFAVSSAWVALHAWRTMPTPRASPP